MKITYLKNGKKHSASTSNSDFTLSEVRDGNHTVVKLLANEELVLAKAEVSYPCHINFKDLYFLNGYQSWTDTR